MTRTLTPWFARVPRLLELEAELPRWMTEVFGPELGAMGREERFLPPVNVVETDKAVEVTVELPGMKPEEVKVEIKNQHLLITGEKKEEKEEQGKTFHRVERRAGMFRRMLPLPAEVMEEKVEARFAEGVLKVTLPKAENAALRQIEVKA